MKATLPLLAVGAALALPVASELQQFKPEDVSKRPEFEQLEQQLRAAREEIRIARADRLPSLSYSFNGGFNTDSIRPPRLKEHTGASAAISFSVPIFDWGASRSRERQARLRAEVTASCKPCCRAQ